MLFNHFYEVRKNNLCTGARAEILIYYGSWREFFVCAFWYVLTELNEMKLACIFDQRKNMQRTEYGMNTFQTLSE